MVKVLNVENLFQGQKVKETIGTIAYATDKKDIIESIDMEEEIGKGSRPLEPLKNAYFIAAGTTEAVEIKNRGITCSFQCDDKNKLYFYLSQIISDSGQGQKCMRQYTGFYSNKREKLEYSFVANSKQKGIIMKKIILNDHKKKFVSSGQLSGCTACSLTIHEKNLAFFFHVGGSAVKDYFPSQKNMDLFNAILYALTLKHSEADIPLLTVDDAKKIYITNEEYETNKDFGTSELWERLNRVLYKQIIQKPTLLIHNYYYDRNSNKDSDALAIRLGIGEVYNRPYQVAGMLLCTYDKGCDKSYYMISGGEMGQFDNRSILIYSELQDVSNNYNHNNNNKCNIV